ncbi:SnodProt1 [Mycena floridula]|nr:SnodProt1 [Mycena floridula]
MRLFCSISLFIASTVATLASMSYDDTYGSPAASLSSVACSDGKYGLLSRFPTFGSLPTYPNVGGISHIEQWDSQNCGSCWEIRCGQKKIYFSGIDSAGETPGNLDLGTVNIVVTSWMMDECTSGMAKELGVLEVEYVQVERSFCGL